MSSVLDKSIIDWLLYCIDSGSALISFPSCFSLEKDSLRVLPASSRIVYKLSSGITWALDKLSIPSILRDGLSLSKYILASGGVLSILIVFVWFSSIDLLQNN